MGIEKFYIRSLLPHGELPMTYVIFLSPDPTCLDHTSPILARAGSSIATFAQPVQTLGGISDFAIVNTTFSRMCVSAVIRRLIAQQSRPVLALVRARSDLEMVRYLDDGATAVIERTVSGVVLVSRGNALLRRSLQVAHAQQDQTLNQPSLRAGALSL